MSGSYLNVKNINLSYSLPRRFVNSIGLSGITFSAAVDNVWVFAYRRGMNPQQGLGGSISASSINTARVSTVGVKVNF